MLLPQVGPAEDALKALPSPFPPPPESLTVVKAGRHQEPWGPDTEAETCGNTTIFITAVDKHGKKIKRLSSYLVGTIGARLRDSWPLTEWAATG